MMKFLMAFLAAYAFSTSVLASSDTAPNTLPAVKVEAAWVRWLPNQRPAAAYMTLKNHRAQPVELISARSSAYAHVSLHQSTVQDGQSKMVRIQHLPIPAYGAVQLMPGGYHLMLEQAKREIAPGDKVDIELSFSDGSVLDTELPVKSPGANVPE